MSRRTSSRPSWRAWESNANGGRTMTVTTTGLSRIHQISMRVHDVDRAVRFYRDALGLQFLFAAPPQLAFFGCGGVRLMLSTPEPGFDHPGSVLYLNVDDIHHSHQTLTSRGVTFKTAPHKI